MRGSLKTKRFFSGFEEAHDTYGALSRGSDGKIYYVLSSDQFDIGGRMYSYDPDTDEIIFLADLTVACGEQDARAVAQGKSHVPFFEHDGHLYFATHVGYYEFIDGMERLPVNPPDGYGLYPGGHFLRYDMESRNIVDLAKAPDGEGIITMAMDGERGHLFGITWPKGYFIHYDLRQGVMHNLGLISEQGEAGTVGHDYRVLCRSILVDDRDGKAYFTIGEGDIYVYDPPSLTLKKLEDANLRLDYFGNYDPTRPGSMAYNWRRILWHQQHKVAYGMHGNSGYLFRFDPRVPSIELVDRLTSVLSQKSGMFDYYTYGYLGFDLGLDGQTIYYLTGGPIYEDGKRVLGEELARGGARGLENLHLVTYHLGEPRYIDHGPIFYDDGSRPTYVNSIAIGPQGHVYTLARFEHEGKTVSDLVKIWSPLKE